MTSFARRLEGSDGYKLETWDDLKKIRKEVIADFKASLYASDGLIEVAFSKSSAEVYNSDIRNNELAGITQRIRDHLSQHGSSLVMKLTTVSVALPTFCGVDVRQHPPT